MGIFDFLKDNKPIKEPVSDETRLFSFILCLSDHFTQYDPDEHKKIYTLKESIRANAKTETDVWIKLREQLSQTHELIPIPYKNSIPCYRPELCELLINESKMLKTYYRQIANNFIASGKTGSFQSIFSYWLTFGNSEDFFMFRDEPLYLIKAFFQKIRKKRTGVIYKHTRYGVHVKLRIKENIAEFTSEQTFKCDLFDQTPKVFSVYYDKLLEKMDILEGHIDTLAKLLKTEALIDILNYKNYLL